jgi:lipopolysaccharide transport system ATP-binding protein
MNLLTGSDLEMDTSATQFAADDVIRMDNVSVRYRIPQERIGTFKEYMIRWVQGKIKHRDLLAVNGVSLHVRRGEVFGIIGQNGAGKSTLLKLVARVLKPTSGRVWVRGRVAPLLEIGAGFHPELTGRENIYLNGAMLGLTRQEMDARFEQIVNFAELWNFIDTPLRSYSSGMWARLGFAVATDVNPDILIVDEILSVGDTAFQRKSAERIDSFRELGVTILLVSHNMVQIENMCERAALLDQGRLVIMGSTKDVVDAYLGRVPVSDNGHLKPVVTAAPAQRWGSRKIEITRVRILNENYEERTIFSTGQELILEIEFYANYTITAPIFGVAIHREDGVHITGPNTAFSNFKIERVDGPGKIYFIIPSVSLLEGMYRMTVATTNRDDTEMFDYHDRVYRFQIDNRGSAIKERYGLMTINGEWKLG